MKITETGPENVGSGKAFTCLARIRSWVPFPDLKKMKEGRKKRRKKGGKKDLRKRKQAGM